MKIVALKAKKHKCTEREGTNVSELKFSKKDIMTVMKYNRATECAAYELDDNTEQFIHRLDVLALINKISTNLNTLRHCIHSVDSVYFKDDETRRFMINRQTGKFIYSSICRHHHLSTSVGSGFCFFHVK